MLKTLATALSLLGFIAISPANADLHGRLAATPGGTDYRAYYDDVTNLTWLKDSNIPWTLERRHLYWDEAVIFGNVLNVAGVTGWRLPSIDRNGDGVIVQCGPRFPDVTLEECKDNEFEALMVSNGFWGSGVNDANGNGRIDEGEVVGDMGPFENFHARLDFWSSNRGKTDAFGNEYAFFYMPPYVDPEVHPTFYLSTHGERLNSSINMQSWYVRSGDVLGENCTNGIDDDGDGLIDENDPDCTPPLVRCHHDPVYQANGGEIVTITAEVLDWSGAILEVDDVEIWLDTDLLSPSFVVSDSSTASLDITPIENFRYGCLARNGARTHFSGWREVAVGEFDFPAIPVQFNGPLAEKVDIVFYHDSDEYSSFLDPDFIQDVGLLISEGFGTMPWFVAVQDYFNFWIGTASDANSGPDPSDDNPDDGIRCLREPPADFETSGTFADSAAIVHRSGCRDNAGPPGIFTVEMDLDRLHVVLHEAGHRPFGLADEYCCDGGYYESRSYQNLFDEETRCRTGATERGFDPDDCRAIIRTSDSEDYWIFEPDYGLFEPEPGDLMQQKGCTAYSNFPACSNIIPPDIVGLNSNPNGLYSCDKLQSAYVGDPDSMLDSGDEDYWLCQNRGSESEAAWSRFRGRLDRYGVGPSELGKLSWYLDECDGGGC